MKKIINILLIAAAATTVCAKQQTLVDGSVKIANPQTVRSGNRVNLDLDFVLDSLDLSSNRGLVYTPMIVNGTDTLRLQSAEVMGRKRYIFYQRNKKSATDNPVFVAQRHNGKAQTEHYSASTAYEDWMQGSQIVVGEGTCGCSQTQIGETAYSPVAPSGLISPEWDYRYAFIMPEAEEVKRREIEGSARLNFVINRYDILPAFGNNQAELQKIRNTIDVARQDSDVTITGITLHGYASPDGKYVNNERLAANRTKALEEYLEQYYSEIPKSLFAAESTAEDWDGVYEYIKVNDAYLPAGFADIVNDDKLTPDQKDETLARKYPDFYFANIKQGLYPSLRRTDYKVAYNIRQFSVEEAKRIIKERPQNLSLNEMYHVANCYEKGSDEFCQVFDVAVRMYPQSELANTNAACASLLRGDLQSAASFLKNAGNSAEAENARGVLAARNGDKESALKHFEAAGSLAEAQSNLEELKKRMK